MTAVSRASVVFAFAVVVLTPAGTQADVRFGAPLASTASDPASESVTPAVAGNASGVVATAYSQNETSTTHVYARVKPSGSAAFGAPQPLGGNAAQTPAAAVEADGTIVVAWEEANPCAGSKVWIATAPPGGAFGTAAKVSDNAFNPHLAVAPGGTIMVLYSHDTGSCSEEVRVQVRPTTGPPVDSPTSDTGSGSVNAEKAAIGIDDNGNAFVAVPQSLKVSPFTKVLRVARRPAGGSWTGTTYTASHASDSVLAVAPDGHVIVANDTSIPAGYATEVRSLAPGDSAFGPPQTITDTSVNDPLSGASIANGGAAAITTQSRHVSVRAAGAASFSSASAPTGLPTFVSNLVPVLTANGELALFDVEKPSGSTDYALVARVQALGGPLGALQPTGLTSDATGPPVLAPFSANDVVAGWENRPQGAANFEAGIAMGDGTPPVMGAVSAPSTGLVGASLPFSASPTDELGVADVRWDFGDGSPVTGTSVTHAFPAVGAAAWSVTATDVGGNAASANGALTIAAPPPVSEKLAVHITRPRRGTRARGLRRFRGTASGPVSRVDVAVVRVLPRAKCASLTARGRLARKLRRAGRKGCTAGRFLKASGTTKWALGLRHRLPAGRYIVFARARSATGAKSPVARITVTLRR